MIRFINYKLFKTFNKLFKLLITGSAGRRDLEETQEEAYFYKQHIEPLLVTMAVYNKSELLSFGSILIKMYSYNCQTYFVVY